MFGTGQVSIKCGIIFLLCCIMVLMPAVKHAVCGTHVEENTMFG